MSRGGSKKRPYYKIVIANSRAPRDGKYLEASTAIMRTAMPAFAEAKGRWDYLSAEEQWKIHGEWMAQKRAEIKACVVDKEARKAKNKEIAAFDHAPVVKLEDEIAALEMQLAQKRKEHRELRAPLTKLEAEYSRITQPDRDKKTLEELVDLEKEWARGR